MPWVSRTMPDRITALLKHSATSATIKGDTDPEQQRPDTADAAHLGRTAYQEVDEPCDSSVGRGHAGVEDPHLDPVLVDPQQVGHRTDNGGTKGPKEGHGAQRDDAGE